MESHQRCSLAIVLVLVSCRGFAEKCADFHFLPPALEDGVLNTWEGSDVNISIKIRNDSCHDTFFPLTVTKKGNVVPDCLIRVYSDGVCSITLNTNTSNCSCSGRNEILFTRYISQSDNGTWEWELHADHTHIVKRLVFNVRQKDGVAVNGDGWRIPVIVVLTVTGLLVLVAGFAVWRRINRCRLKRENRSEATFECVPMMIPWDTKQEAQGNISDQGAHGTSNKQPAQGTSTVRVCGISPPSSDNTRAAYRILAEVIPHIRDKNEPVTLRERQQTILYTEGDLKFLSGPPGTGKSVLLIQKAAQWITVKKHVQVVSTWTGSLASSHYIASELRRITKKPDLVHVHTFFLNDGDKKLAVKKLLDAATTGPLCVICDEAFPGSVFGEMCTQLTSSCPGLCLWVASVYHGYRPSCLEEATLTEPLRTPPTITMEVTRSDIMEQGLVRKYDPQVISGNPLTDGVPLIKIAHEGFGHSRDSVDTCKLCGEQLGDVLRELLAECRSLRYSDVFILTTYFDLEDGAEGQGEDKSADAGDDSVHDRDVSEKDEEDPTTSGMLVGLKKKNVPYRMVAKGNSRALREVTEMAGPDAVVVAETDTIRGLERNIVVWVPHDMNDKSGQESFGRLDAMSRARALLILFTD